MSIMREVVLLAIVLVCVARASGGTDPAATTQPVRITPDMMESHAIVLLIRGDNPPSLSDDEVQQLQVKHLEHINAMVSAGKCVIAGPFRQQSNVAMRGMCIFASGVTVEEAARLCGDDPMVRAGHLKIEVMNWMTMRGHLAFPAAKSSAR